MNFYLNVLMNHQAEGTAGNAIDCTCGKRVTVWPGGTLGQRLRKAFAEHQADEITEALRGPTSVDPESVYEHTETSPSGVTINATVSLPTDVRSSIAGQSVHDAVQLISDRIRSDE